MKPLWTLVLGGLLLLGVSLGGPAAQAMSQIRGFAPSVYPGNTQYGQGVVVADETVTLYREPRKTAEVVDVWHWSAIDGQRTLLSDKTHRPFVANHALLAFYPSLKIALLPVIGEGDDGWVEVLPNQGSPETAWVLTRAPEVATLASSSGVYLSWSQFMKLNARTYGINWLKGVDEYTRAVRTQPEDKAKLLPYTVMKDMKVLHARGNWLLVEVQDMNRERPMGWVRWRSEDGQLLAFPNFIGAPSAIVMPLGNPAPLNPLQ